MARGRILIADDEVMLTNTLRKVVGDAGYTVEICTGGEEFFPRLSEAHPDVIVLDIFLGDINGIDLLRRMRAEGWKQPVIMMTAHSDVSLAVRAMKEGAADFVVKPFDLNHLVALIEKNLEHARMETRMRILQEEVEQGRTRGAIIGKSWTLRRVMETAEKLAQSEDTTVLLEGESGTGKEMIARFLHQKSARAEKPFITLNCGAIPKDLAESEFFGHEKGAFTGAGEKLKQGKFELADGGTILLDEIAELSLDMQVKLLRVLEDKRFYRLGGIREIAVDVRIIAASNRELFREVENGHFREDLYYRLNVASISIPPLRNRREDIPVLIDAFLQDLCARFNRAVPTITSEALHFLEQLPWRGNVRELRNAIERVMLLTSGPTLGLDHFLFLRPESVTGTRGGSTNGKNFVLEIPPTGVAMNEVVKELILKTLDLVGGNQVQAAKVLGLTRSKLRYRMEQLGIHPEHRTYRASTGVR